MPVLSTSEFRAFTGIGTTQVSDVQAQALCDAGSKAVEKYLGRSLDLTATTEFYSGTGTKHLILRRRPVTTVAEVRYDPHGYFGSVAGSFDDSTVLVEGVDWTLVKDNSSNGSDRGLLLRITGLWVEYPRRRESFRLSQDMVPNHGDVQVTYTAGYGDAPADLKLACAQLITKARQYLNQGGPLLSEHLGDYSYKVLEYHLAKNPDLGSARQLLASYRELPW